MFKNYVATQISLCPQNVKAFDTVVVFNPEDGKLYAFDSTDIMNANYEDYRVITKTSQLKSLGTILLLGLRDFIYNCPDSELTAYMEATHNAQVKEAFDMYVASYIHLYRNYKSLSVLAANGYFNLIDTFIDCCINENTDHPGTLSYSSFEIHKVFKLRKAVYNTMKKYLDDHDMYRYILEFAKTHKFSDQRFREVKKAFKLIEAKEKEKQNPLPLTLETVMSYLKEDEQAPEPVDCAPSKDHTMASAA